MVFSYSLIEKDTTAAENCSLECGAVAKWNLHFVANVKKYNGSRPGLGTAGTDWQAHDSPKRNCLGPLLPTRHANLSQAPQLLNQGLNEKKQKDNEGSVERTSSKVPDI